MSLKDTGFFICGVDSVINDKALARIRGIVREDSILLRIHYLKRSLNEPAYTGHHVIDQSAMLVHDYLRDAEGVYVEFENVFEFVKEQFELQNTGLTRIEPSYEGKKDLDKLDEKMAGFYYGVSRDLFDVGLSPMNREGSDYREEPNDGDVLFTKEIVIPKSSMITYLEKDSKLPFSTMQKIHEKVLESCSSSETFSVNKGAMKELMYYLILFEDVKCLPPNDDQPKKYRFKIDGKTLVDTGDYFEGMKELVSMFEKGLI